MGWQWSCWEASPNSAQVQCPSHQLPEGPCTSPTITSTTLYSKCLFTGLFHSGWSALCRQSLCLVQQCTLHWQGYLTYCRLRGIWWMNEQHILSQPNALAQVDREPDIVERVLATSWVQDLALLLPNYVILGKSCCDFTPVSLMQSRDNPAFPCPPQSVIVKDNLNFHLAN